MTERIIYLDVIRIVAMLLVVACHCFGDVTDVSPELISLLTYLEMPCIGLFLAISGALLLPVKSSTDDFLRRRLTKIIIPTVFWSVVYMMLGNRLTIINIIGVVFRPVGDVVLWFVYMIIGLYLLSPVISPWLERVSKKELQMYLLLWSVTLCFPIFDNWIITDSSFAGWAYYFSGYIGYFVLGFYLRKYGMSLKNATLIYFALLGIMAVVKIRFHWIELYSVFWFTSIFGAGGVVFYWSVLKRISENISGPRLIKTITGISGLVFGIYFVHIGLAKYVAPIITIEGCGYLAVYLVRVTVIFLSALLISWLISFLPFSNYLIGYHYKNKRIKL